MDKPWTWFSDLLIDPIRRDWPKLHAAAMVVLVAVLVVTSASLPIAASLDLDGEGKVLTVVLANAIVLVLIGWAWLQAWRDFKVQDGRIGVLVALVSSSTAEDEKLRMEFIDSLREQLRHGASVPPFQLKVLPKHLVDRLNENPEQNAPTVLQERGAQILIFGRVREVELDGGKGARDVRLDGHVQHAPISLGLSRALSEDMARVLPRHFVIANQGSLYQFEAASERLELATRYVVGLAAMLSGNLDHAETLLVDVEQRVDRVRAANRRQRGVRELRHRLPERLTALYGRRLSELVGEYLRTRDPQLAVALEQVAKSLLKRAPANYPALLSLSMCIFIARRDVRAALAVLKQCAHQPDAAWRYSKAFLLAYSGKLEQAQKEYERAFRAACTDLTLPVQCEEFIHLVLDEEPNCAQLYFCLGLINRFEKQDHQAAKRDFERFLALVGDDFPREQVLARKWLSESPSVETGERAA